MTRVYPPVATALNASEWDVLDGIIEEARLTRGNKYTQEEAVTILVEDRYQRGILNAKERENIFAYLFGKEE